DRDAARSAEPRQHADDESQDDADEQEGEVDRLQRRREAAREVPKNVHLEREPADVEDALWKDQLEADLEEHVDRGRRDDRGREREVPLVATEVRGEETHERAGREIEAQPLE